MVRNKIRLSLNVIVVCQQMRRISNENIFIFSLTLSLGFLFSWWKLRLFNGICVEYESTTEHHQTRFSINSFVARSRLHLRAFDDETFSCSDNFISVRSIQFKEHLSQWIVDEHLCLLFSSTNSRNKSHLGYCAIYCKCYHESMKSHLIN